MESARLGEDEAEVKNGAGRSLNWNGRAVRSLAHSYYDEYGPLELTWRKRGR